MALLGKPGECSSLLQTGGKLYAGRNFDQAAATFEQAYSLCAEPQTLILLAKAQLMAQRVEQSLAVLNRYLAGQQRDADALKLKGDVLYLLGREQDAEDTLLHALEIQPEHAEAEYALARIRYQQNRFPEAIERFRKLIDRDPRNYKAQDNLALCYAAMQQDALALTHFLKALELVHKSHPEYDTVYANASRFFFDHGDFEKAFQLGAEAAKRNPSYARNFFLTGKALVRLDRDELSIRWFRQAADLDPTYKDPHYWLATVYRKLGKPDEAERSLARFRELSKVPEVKR